MSKRPLGKGTDSKTTQTDIPADTQKKNTNQLIEMAAEEVADLLWKCWLVSNNPRRSRRTESGSQPDSPGRS